MKYLYAFLVFAAMAGIFVLIYILNARTKKPENCKELPEECEGCRVSVCNRNPNHKKKEEK